MRAPTEDQCASGYRLFRQSRGTLDIVTLNEQLRYYGHLKPGDPEISERTFKHYLDLWCHHSHTYWPVNRWLYVLRDGGV